MNLRHPKTTQRRDLPLVIEYHDGMTLWCTHPRCATHPGWPLAAGAELANGAQLTAAIEHCLNQDDH